MIILKLTGVFEIHVHSKMIILNKTDDFELYVEYKVMKLQLSFKILCFQVFSKDRGIFRTQSNI